MFSRPQRIVYLAMFLMMFALWIPQAFALNVLYQGGIEGSIGPLTGGNMAAFKGEVDDCKRSNPESLLVSCGNMLGPSLVSVGDGGKTMVRLMNECGFDVVAVGPNEFFAGFSTLLERIHEARFPVVLTNVSFGCAEGTEAPDTSLIKPFVWLERGGKKILVFGTICPTVEKDWPAWSCSVHLSNPVEALEKYRDEAAKADLVILLSNVSFRDTVILMQRLKWVNLVITNPMAPDEVFFGESLDFALRDGRRICWTLPNNPLPGCVSIEGGAAGNIPGAARPEPNSANPPDSGIAALVEAAEGAITASLSHQIAELSQPEISDPVAALLDALRGSLNAEIALMTEISLAQVVKNGLPKNLTEIEIRSAFTFPDKVALVPVAGAKLREIWNRRNDPHFAGAGLKFAGITEKDGKLIVNGRLLNPNDIYRVATTEYLARGGFTLLTPYPAGVRNETVVNLWVRFFAQKPGERAKIVRRVEKKPISKQILTLRGSFSQLDFSDEAAKYQYSDPKASYTGSDIPELVGARYRQKTFGLHWEGSSLKPDAELLGRFDSTYAQFKDYKQVDKWSSTWRYQKTSFNPRWLPFVEVDLAGTNLKPDMAGKRHPFLGKAVVGLARKNDDHLLLFAGLGRVFQFSADGAPQSNGVHLGYEYSCKIGGKMEFSSLFSWFSSPERDKVLTFDGNAGLKFPIFRQLSAQIRYSMFGWRDSTVGGGTATRAETFTGLTYDLSSRRF